MAEERTVEMPAAAPGEPCAGCGSPLAADQRYCLNCGRRRGDARVDYAPLLAGAQPGREEERTPAPTSSASPAPAPAREASPLVAVAGIALLGLMLLVGVLIGRGGGDGTETAATPTVLQVGEGSGAKVADAGAAGDAAGDSGSADGGSEKTSSNGADGADSTNDPSLENPEVASRDELEALENATGEEQQDASENLPDTIAIPGEPPPTDHEEPGGGSQAQVIK